MRIELEAEGHNVAFALINSISAAGAKFTLAGLVSAPMFQDVPQVQAWQLQGGKKDDIFIYDADHKLHSYFTMQGGVPMTLKPIGGTGYTNVKNAILGALGAL
jgi:hypothetical protein